MELFSILCFVTLAQCSKFYEAAETLHLSQSSFSKHIQALERDLGTKLFLRHPLGSELTDAGKALLPYAESIMQEYAKAERLIDAYKKNSGRRLVIYTHSFLTHYGISEMLVHFQNKYPDIQLEIHELSSRLAIQTMRKEPQQPIVCIAFSELETTYAQFDSRMLLRDELVLLVSNDHHYAQKESVNFSMLRDETIQIMHVKQSPFLYDFVMKQCAKAGFSPKVSPYGLGFSTILEVIVSHNFVSILPRKIAERVHKPDIKMIELEGADDFLVLLLKTKDNSSAVAKAFFEFANGYTFPE